MRTLIKVVWTVAFLTVVAWPLLFWGKPALPEQQNGEKNHMPLPYSQSGPKLLW